jgi:hypothetical protein
MTSWTLDNPATLDFDEVTDLEVPLNRLPGQTRAPISPRSLSRRVRGEFAGARSGNVGGMSGNVSVTSASGAITLLRRERVESETR